MVYRNPYQGYSDQEYGYTDDDHLKGHYSRYNGQAGHTGNGQYGQEEYVHQNGYSTQVSTPTLNFTGLKTMTECVLSALFYSSVINIQTPWPGNCYDNELITIKATVEREV